MSGTEPSRDVPIACITYFTRSWRASRRWISAMYSDALASGRPRAMTVRSAVARALPGLVGPAVRAADGRGDRRLEDVPALAVVERGVLADVRALVALTAGADRGLRALAADPVSAAAERCQGVRQLHGPTPP